VIGPYDRRSLAMVYDVQQDNLAEMLINLAVLTANPSAGAADRTHQSESLRFRRPWRRLEVGTDATHARRRTGSYPATCGLRPNRFETFFGV
jgi:hypothetical protein